MKTTTIAPVRAAGMIDMFAHLPFGPKINFAPENGDGTGTNDDTGGDDAAAKAAADKAAADKAAADKAAADAAEAAARANETEAQKLLREVMEKKQKIKDAEAREAELTAQLKKFEGIDPDAVRAMLDKQRADEIAAEEAKGNFETVKKRMAEEHERATGALKTENETLLSQIDGLKKEIDELTIGRNFSESVYIGEDLAMPRSKARKLYGGHFERVDGATVGYDKPAGEANRTMLVDASGNALPFDEAFKRIIEADPDKESLLRVKAKPGAGSTTQKVKGQEQERNTGLSGVSRIEAGLLKRLQK